MKTLEPNALSDLRHCCVCDFITATAFSIVHTVVGFKSEKRGLHFAVPLSSALTSVFPTLNVMYNNKSPGHFIFIFSYTLYYFIFNFFKESCLSA